MNMIPPTSKLDLADQLEKYAQSLRDTARREHEMDAVRERVQRHRSRVKDARDMLKAYLWQGIDATRAALMAEQQTGIDRDTLKNLVDKIIAEIQREKRNRQIMQKAALGWTNAALADHFGLSEKYVQRIISRIRATAHTEPPQSPPSPKA